MTGKSVVLGLDRSPGADRALALAVRLAASLDVPLVLVHGVAPPGGVGEEAGEAREAIEEFDDAVIRPGRRRRRGGRGAHGGAGRRRPARPGAGRGRGRSTTPR